MSNLSMVCCQCRYVWSAVNAGMYACDINAGMYACLSGEKKPQFI